MAGGDGQLACYRHSGRGTRISCSRCGRPICPDCMNDAPVGFQCPECVKEGRATRPRTVTGAQLVARPGAVSYTLVIANVLVYLLHGSGDAHHADWALFPYWVDHGQYYRLFTASFVHFGILHIALNMFVLATVGPQLEAVLGRVRFGALYLVSIAGSSALSYLLLPDNGAISGGASGAIFGLMGGLFVVAKRLNLDTRQLNGWIIYSLVFSFIPGLNVDWRAHIGGLITGGAVTWGMVHAPRQNRGWVQAGAVLAGFIVAVVVIAIRTATFPNLTG
jgi:membrane associated rhomboid family serine protease